MSELETGGTLCPVGVKGKGWGIKLWDKTCRVTFGQVQYSAPSG